MNKIYPAQQTLGLLQQYYAWKTYFSNYPLLHRITSSNWKVVLMDCSTVITVTSCAIALFLGSTLASSAFLVAAVSSGVGAFYMRQFTALSDLQTTVHGLQETKERFEGIVATLQTENNRLTNENDRLQANNTLYTQNNQNLMQTNAQLNTQVNQLGAHNYNLQQTNTQLNSQVNQLGAHNYNLQQTNANLELQVSQLGTHNIELTRKIADLTLQSDSIRSSAEKIRDEVARFAGGNEDMKKNLETLTRHLDASNEWCALVSNTFNSKQAELWQLFQQLQLKLSEAVRENSTLEKLKALEALEQRLQNANDKLHNTQLASTEAHAKLETLQKVLTSITQRLDLAIDRVSNDMHANNEDLQRQIRELAQVKLEIQQSLNNANLAAPFPGGTPVAAWV